jgi:tetratricopeptide (TPR) repeat protein
MNRSKWDSVFELFLQAAELTGDERNAFLDIACHGDAELRLEVEAMLACDSGSDDRLRQIVVSAAVELHSAQAAEAVGQRIGPYVIEREIGRGGMGTVYLASRDDGQFRQRVAIKVVGRGMDSEFTLTLFRRERQVLADLQHPNIARLLDGGATADGQPFFAMEYLEGIPLTAHCEQERLSTKARLQLFLQVCSAVEYAHSNLVVHGDLKPGNILISGGIPRLLDFGIATLIDAHSESVSAPLPITAKYASPEQRSGGSLNTAADIYSLGAVLRELPDQECGEIADIAAMAMRPEPSERYSSVAHLAADIQRYLDGMPVRAHRQTAWYRISKYARRRWLPLLAATAAVLALVIGATVALVQAREARRARQRAEDRLTLMVGLSNRSLTDVAALMERLPGATPARQALVGANLDLLKKLSSNAGLNVPLRISLAKAYHRLGDVQGGPDVPSPMDRASAEESFRAAGALLEGISGREGGIEPVFLWLEAQRKIGTLLDARSDTTNAIAVLSRAVAEADQLPAAQREEKNVRQSVAAMYMILSRSSGHDDLKRAGEYAALCLKEFEALNRSYPNDADLQYDLSRAYVQAGFIMLTQGDPSATAPHYEKALRLREQLVNEHPSDTLYRRSLLLMYQHYAAVQGSPLVPNLDQAALAKMYYEKALAFYESGPHDPHDVTGIADYGGLVVRLGALSIPGQDPAQSLATLRRGAGILESAGIASGDLSPYRISLAVAYLYMGHRLMAMHRPAEAVADYRRAVDLTAPILQKMPNDHDASKTSFDAECGLAVALASNHNRETALALAQALVAKTAEDPARNAQAYLCAADVRRELHEREAAAAAAREALNRIQPVVSARRGDPNTLIARQAKATLAGLAGK